MALPMAEMLGWLRTGVGEPIRGAGLQVMESFCVVVGQKVPVKCPRQTVDGKVREELLPGLSTRHYGRRFANSWSPIELHRSQPRRAEAD
jgi:hypothetical protein